MESPSAGPDFELSLCADCDRLIAAQDILAIYGLARRFAACSVGIQATLKTKIKAALPAFRMAEFSAEIRAQAKRLDIREGPRLVNGQGSPHWTSDPRFLRSDRGIRAVVANAILALELAPEWKGVLGYSEFAGRVEARLETPWGPSGVWQDRDDVRLAAWLQEFGILCGTAIAREAADVSAAQHAFHPVRDYLAELVWDGKQRVFAWLHTYLGADNARFTSHAGLRWLVSAVARIFSPGCKADCLLVLEGVQGLKKSSTIDTLAAPWFTDRLSSMAKKDSYEELAGVWIVEIADLHGFSKAEVETIKNFFSIRTDRYRPSYGRRVIEQPRQCVFAASTNKQAYLGDETGGRRFWPVACHKADIEALKRDRDQLWAEAVALYRAGQIWWLEDAELTAEAAEAVEQRREEDVWEQAVRNWAENPLRRVLSDTLYTSQENSITVRDVLIHALGKEEGDLTHGDRLRVVRALSAAGWEQFGGGAAGRRYRRRT